jgi:hypothetical protein
VKFVNTVEIKEKCTLAFAPEALLSHYSQNTRRSDLYRQEGRPAAKRRRLGDLSSRAGLEFCVA